MIDPHSKKPSASEPETPLETVGSIRDSTRLRDALVVGGITLATTLIAAALDLFEKWVAVTQRLEAFELDELTIGVFAGALSLIWYAWRRQRVANRLRLLAVRHAHAADTANRAKTRFLASVSHDLRTPLNAISGFSEIIAKEMLGPVGTDKYRQYAHDIGDSSQHLLALVNDVLDLATIETGRLELELAPVDLQDIVDACCRIVSVGAEAKDIACVCRVSETLPSLVADRRAVQQILINLLSNSVKFTPKGGRVSLDVDAENGEHVLRITDSGEGIAPELIPAITEPFVRGPRRNGRAHSEGSGLGLSIVKSLVELHGGSLSFDSELGRGTTVTVRLPSAASDL